MQYGKIDGLKLPVSRVVLGCSSDPMRKGENCDELFDLALSSGINAFDTARGYGESERAIGEWLARRGTRDRVSIFTKGALHGLLGNSRVREKCIRADLKKSLSTLNVDKIDLYLLHRDDERRGVDEIVELLNEFIADGKIGAYGLSNWTAERLQEAKEYALSHGLVPPSASEPQFSLADVKRFTWIGCHSVSGEKGKEERAWYRESELPLLAFSPIARGFLSGAVHADNWKNEGKKLPFDVRVAYVNEDNAQKLRRVEEIAKERDASVADVALAYVLSADLNGYAVIGASKEKHIVNAVSAAEISLSKEEIGYLEEGK